MRWLSGYCTKLGPRSSNEDRLIAIPDLHEEMEMLSAGITNGNSSSSHSGSSGSSSSSGVGSNFGSSSKPARNGKSSSLCGYFGVYDGHSGHQASTYLERELHTALFNHPLFESDLQTTITETCKKIDKVFVV